MAEDMGPRVGAFGDTVSRTPNLDALAEAGVRYDNVFTTAGVCAPSRAAHILGVHQIATGSQHMRTSTRPEGAYFSVPPPHIKAYPELLRAAGYYTFTDSKLDYQFSSTFAGTGPFTIWDADDIRHWGGREKNQPFFGLINYMETHESGIFTPLGHWPHSLTHLFMQIWRWWTLEDPVADTISPDTISLPPYFPDTETVRRDMVRHYGNIRDMDYQVGRVLERLEQQGLAENTIVIWTTDHGDGLPRAKRELYDSGIRVPMIIRWPEKYRPEHLKPGDLDSGLISFVDLAPTILQMAGVEAPEYLQGKNFLESETPGRDYVFASRDRIDEVPDRQRAVRNKRFKYIRSWGPNHTGWPPTGISGQYGNDARTATFA